MNAEAMLMFAGWSRDERAQILSASDGERMDYLLDAAEEIGLAQEWLRAVIRSTDRGEVERACRAAGATYTLCPHSRRRKHAHPGRKVRVSAQHKPGKHRVTGQPYPTKGRAQ